MKSLSFCSLNLMLAVTAFPVYAAGQIAEKPAPAEFLSQLKVMSGERNPIRVPVEDWAGARRRTETDKQWAQWLEQKRKEVDGWISRHKDRTEWISGWSHDFISPKDGSALIWTEEIPGEEVQFLASATDPKVAITPQIKGAWIQSFRNRHQAMLIEAARLFRLTGEVRYAEYVAGQLDFYALNYDKWPTTRGGSAHLGWQSLEDAQIVSQLIEVSRLIFDWAGETRRQMWFEKLFKPEVELLDGHYQNIHNIASWHRSACAQVAMLYGDEEMLKRQLDGKNGIRAQFRLGMTADYFWNEQSLSYNDYVVKAIFPLFYMAGLKGRGALLHEEAIAAQNLMLSPLQLRFADGNFPNPADSVGKRQFQSPLFLSTYRVFPTYIGLKTAATVRDWNTLLDPPQSVSQSSFPAVVSQNFAATNYALLKQGKWQVFFHYGQVAESHSQGEALNWSAYYGDTDITHDPGTARYGSPLSGEYYRRGLNHNIPLINGEGQTPWNRGEMTAFDAVKGEMTATQPKYQSNASARRTLRVVGEKLIDEAEVNYTGKEPNGAKLGLALHLQGTPRLTDKFVASPDFANQRPQAFKYWNDVRAATFTDQAELLVDYPEGVVMRLKFSTSGKFTLYGGSSPDYPGSRRAGFYVELADPARKAVFITEIAPVTKP